MKYFVVFLPFISLFTIATAYMSIGKNKVCSSFISRIAKKLAREKSASLRMSLQDADSDVNGTSSSFGAIEDSLSLFSNPFSKLKTISLSNFNTALIGLNTTLDNLLSSAANRTKTAFPFIGGTVVGVLATLGLLIRFDSPIDDATAGYLKPVELFEQVLDT